MLNDHNQTTDNAVIPDSFTDDAWDELCIARIKYNNHTDRGLWYAALRVHCAYQSGQNHKLRTMGEAVDQWLARHPSWRGRYL